MKRSDFIALIDKCLENSKLSDKHRQRVREVAETTREVARGASSVQGIGCPLKQASVWTEVNGANADLQSVPYPPRYLRSFYDQFDAGGIGGSYVIYIEEDDHE